MAETMPVIMMILEWICLTLICQYQIKTRALRLLEVEWMFINFVLLKLTSAHLMNAYFFCSCLHVHLHFLSTCIHVCILYPCLSLSLSLSISFPQSFTVHLYLFLTHTCTPFFSYNSRQCYDGLW